MFVAMNRLVKSLVVSTLALQLGLTTQLQAWAETTASTAAPTSASNLSGTSQAGSGPVNLDLSGQSKGSLVDLTGQLGNINNLAIPKGVTAVIDFGALSGLNLTGNFTNAGHIYAYSSNPDVGTASIAAANIHNQQGGLLTTILPAAGLPGIVNVVSNLNLSLSALHNIINAGTISSAGNLSAVAGGAIVNALPAGTGGTNPVMSAMGSMNLQAMNIVNQGIMSAQLGSINAATATLLNTGVMQALAGNISIVNSLYSHEPLSVISSAQAANQVMSAQEELRQLVNEGMLAAASSEGTIAAPDGQILCAVGDPQWHGGIAIEGGTLDARAITFQAGAGHLALHLTDVNGPISLQACTADMSVSHGTHGLQVVNVQVVGDPDYDIYEQNGNIYLPDFMTYGGHACLQADNGDIKVDGGIDTAGGYVVLSAGNGDIYAGYLRTAGGSVDVFAPGGSVTIPGGIDAGSGGVDIHAGEYAIVGHTTAGDVTINARLETIANDAIEAPSISLYGGKAVNVENLTGNQITIKSDTAGVDTGIIRSSGNVNIRAGSDVITEGISAEGAVVDIMSGLSGAGKTTLTGDSKAGTLSVFANGDVTANAVQANKVYVSSQGTIKAELLQAQDSANIVAEKDILGRYEGPSVWLQTRFGSITCDTKADKLNAYALGSSSNIAISQVGMDLHLLAATGQDVKIESFWGLFADGEVSCRTCELKANQNLTVNRAIADASSIKLIANRNAYINAPLTATRSIEITADVVEVTSPLTSNYDLQIQATGSVTVNALLRAQSCLVVGATTLVSAGVQADAAFLTANNGVLEASGIEARNVNLSANGNIIATISASTLIAISGEGSMTITQEKNLPLAVNQAVAEEGTVTLNAPGPVEISGAGDQFPAVKAKEILINSSGSYIFVGAKMQASGYVHLGAGSGIYGGASISTSLVSLYSAGGSIGTVSTPLLIAPAEGDTVVSLQVGAQVDGAISYRNTYIRGSQDVAIAGPCWAGEFTLTCPNGAISVRDVVLSQKVDFHASQNVQVTGGIEATTSIALTSDNGAITGPARLVSPVINLRAQGDIGQMNIEGRSSVDALSRQGSIVVYNSGPGMDGTFVAGICTDNGAGNVEVTVEGTLAVHASSASNDFIMCVGGDIIVLGPILARNVIPSQGGQLVNPGVGDDEFQLGCCPPVPPKQPDPVAAVACDITWSGSVATVSIGPDRIVNGVYDVCTYCLSELTYSITDLVFVSTSTEPVTMCASCLVSNVPANVTLTFNGLFTLGSSLQATSAVNITAPHIDGGAASGAYISAQTVTLNATSGSIANVQVMTASNVSVSAAANAQVHIQNASSGIPVVVTAQTGGDASIDIDGMASIAGAQTNGNLAIASSSVLNITSPVSALGSLSLTAGNLYVNALLTAANIALSSRNYAEISAAVTATGSVDLSAANIYMSTLGSGVINATSITAGATQGSIALTIGTGLVSASAVNNIDLFSTGTINVGSISAGGVVTINAPVINFVGSVTATSVVLPQTGNGATAATSSSGAIELSSTQSTLPIIDNATITLDVPTTTTDPNSTSTYMSDPSLPIIYGYSWNESSSSSAAPDFCWVGLSYSTTDTTASTETGTNLANTTVCSQLSLSTGGLVPTSIDHYQPVANLPMPMINGIATIAANPGTSVSSLTELLPAPSWQAASQVSPVASDDNLKPVAAIEGVPAQVSTLLNTHRRHGDDFIAARLAVLTQLAKNRYKLAGGAVAVHSTETLTIETPDGRVTIKPGTLAVVSVEAGLTNVLNLLDVRANGVSVLSAAHQFNLYSGSGVGLLAQGTAQACLDDDQLPRRSLRVNELGSKVAIGYEFSLLASLIKVPVLADLRMSTQFEHKQLINQVLKMAAARSVVTDAARGRYSASLVSALNIKSTAP